MIEFLAAALYDLVLISGALFLGFVLLVLVLWVCRVSPEKTRNGWRL